MIEAEEALRTWLVTDPDIFALVDTRVYPNDKVPQGAGYPRITYQRIAGDRERTLAGVSSPAHPTIQLDCVDTNYGRLKGLVRLIKGTEAGPRLDGFQGNLGGLTVQCVTMTNEFDTYRLLTDGSDKGEHIVSMDFEIWNNEV